MERFIAVYRGVVKGFAAIACVMLAIMFLSVIADVTIRASGAQPPGWAVPLSEYLLLYITLLGSPWVLQEKGHVLIDSFTSALSPAAQRWLARAVCLCCAAVCAAIMLIAAQSTWDEFMAGSSDVRAVLVPKYLMYLPYPPSFLLMLIEFLVLAFGRETLVAGDPSHGAA